MDSGKLIRRHLEEMERKDRTENREPVVVWSRQHINKGFGKNGVLISILQPLEDGLFNTGQEFNTKSIELPGWRKILSLRFLDSTPLERQNNLFTEQDADDVWRFVEDVQPNEVINVHCAAGISRSVAVGMVLSETLERRLEVMTGVGVRFANPHVVALMRRKIWNAQLQ